MKTHSFVAILAAFLLASCSSSVESPDLVVSGVDGADRDRHPRHRFGNPGNMNINTGAAVIASIYF